MFDLSRLKSIGEDLYIAERVSDSSKASALVVAGSSVDLSFVSDGSFDCIISVPKERVRTVKDVAAQEEVLDEVKIITDHPYLLPNSLKGRNRNFADYELFQYDEKDMLEKYRILKLSVPA